MTFLGQDNFDKDNLEPHLSQRARAGFEFLGNVQIYSSGTIRVEARKDFESDPEGKALILADKRGGSNAAQEDRIADARGVAERYPSFRLERFLQRYVAEEVFLRGIPAAEEQRSQFEALTQMPPDNPKGTLELCEELHIPDYYKDVDWHLEPGGWDGYDLYGALLTHIATPYIYRHGGYAAVEHGDDIFKQRLDVVGQLPKSSYDRIYEPGCGGFSTLFAAHKLFPKAELVGSDLSSLLLRNGHAVAERLSIEVTFKQRDARDSGEPSASFDAVLMYALMHEMPVEVVIEVFREAQRILKPGGDLVISDPPPFRAVDPFQAVILDWDTEHRGEPFFSEACSADWAEELRALGFVNVEEYGLGERGYPWVTRAMKAE